MRSATCTSSTELAVHPLKVSPLMDIELWKLEPFFPHRKFAPSDEEYAALLEDIDRHGIQEPLLLDFSCRVLDGHARLQAALDLGLPSVPARVLWNISSQECYLIGTAGTNSSAVRYMGLKEKLEALRPAVPMSPPDATEPHVTLEFPVDTGDTGPVFGTATGPIEDNRACGNFGDTPAPVDGGIAMRLGHLDHRVDFRTSYGGHPDFYAIAKRPWCSRHAKHHGARAPPWP